MNHCTSCETIEGSWTWNEESPEDWEIICNDCGDTDCLITYNEDYDQDR